MIGDWITELMGGTASPVSAVAAFLIRVVLCILVYLIGKKAIAWIVRSIRKMLGRTKMQEGAVTFTCSMTKILVTIHGEPDTCCQAAPESVSHAKFRPMRRRRI